MTQYESSDYNDYGMWIQASDHPQDVVYFGYDLIQALRGPEWKQDALCRTPNSENLKLFFPEEQTHGGNHLIEPRKMCLKCPVRYECLEFGLNEPYGVWGGHSPSQRKRILKLVKSGSSLVDASQSVERRAPKKKRMD